MSAAQPGADGSAISNAWTQEVAGDLFPGAVTPFAWSVLAAPVEDALRRAWSALGAPAPAQRPLWQRRDGRVYLSAPALADAARALHGAAWLGAAPPEAPLGMLARLQSAGIRRQAQAAIAQAAAQVAPLHARLHAWLSWVRGLSWTQADLLQVMEELEPRAKEALQTYFIAAAGLNAARTQADRQLSDWLPALPPGVKLGLYVGTAGLPTIEAAYSLAAAAELHPDDPVRQNSLARYGHRGPGEIGPNAYRWGDTPELLARLAGQTVLHTPEAAAARRAEAEAWIRGRLNPARAREAEDSVARVRDLCRAVDRAWDALAMVMAAAQRWLHAASVEALAAGLINRPEDGSYLELEELKQVATGEWHRGRSDDVQAEVMQRRAHQPAQAQRAGQALAGLSPGQARGPAYLAAAPPRPGPDAIWLADHADPGCAPFWPAARALVTAAADPWTPGLVAARALGLPVVGGAHAVLAQAQPGQMIQVDGDAARITFG